MQLHTIIATGVFVSFTSFAARTAIPKLLTITGESSGRARNYIAPGNSVRPPELISTHPQLIYASLNPRSIRRILLPVDGRSKAANQGPAGAKGAPGSTGSQRVPGPACAPGMRATTG